MNKIYNKRFDETYYEETLDNGLKVIIFYKPDFSSTCACFGTPYGALNLHQKLNGKEYNFSPGIAHFLEHKLFEAQGKDIMTRFSEIGSNVNAFTSYKETVYYFSKSDPNIEESLNLLLDFVQDLDISNESVEKEKGIICEELSMYKQNPDSELINAAYRAIYHEYPLNIDIGGTADTVNKITKDELEECYSINYHPSNMVLTIVSCLEPEHIIDIVRNNQAKKNFIKQNKILVNNKAEINSVVKEYDEFKMDVNSDKVCYIIKLKPDFKDHQDAALKEAAMKMYLNAYFTKINPDYQKWMNEGIINDYFDFDVDFDLDYAYILFVNETSDAYKFKEFIDNELKKDKLTEDILNQILRSTIGQAYRAFDVVDDFAISFIRDYLEGINSFDAIDEQIKLSYPQVIDIKNAYNLSNYSLIHILPSKNESKLGLK